MGTLHAVARAVDEHMPLISRVVTVTGAVKQPRNLRVRIGTPFSALLAQCGGMTCEGGKVIAGGPMTGPAQHTLEVPVAKGTTAVLVLPPAEAALPEAGPCIRCGRCVDICPMGLEPIFISAYMLRDETEKLEGLHADACIACGSCSFICPAKLPLTQGCVLARDYVRKHKAKA